MGSRKAISLCVALVFGSVFAVAVSNWQEQGARPQANGRTKTVQEGTAESAHQPELLARQPQAGASGLNPASYQQPESSPPVMREPALLPADEQPSEQLPSELDPDEPAPAADAGGKSPSPADRPAAEQGAAQTDPADASFLAWHDDYAQAMDAAVARQRMMLIFFFDPRRPDAIQQFEQQSLADPRNRELLSRDFVWAKLPTDSAITSGGKPLELLKHPAFAEMLGRSGVAILDFAHPGAEYFGRVVSTFPFVAGKYYSRPVLSTVLGLPPGTLTQRTMIYAVRIHPEAPASAQGEFNGVLAEEANRHSNHQAAILVQGHHNWDSRFQRINTRLPSGVMAQEVVAESWPSENLVDACIDCVDSWRHSPGHWEAVRTRHPLFGFDIQRGRNGIWYATGIFGHR